MLPIYNCKASADLYIVYILYLLSPPNLLSLLLAFTKRLGFCVQKNHSFILTVLGITDGEINLNQVNCEVASMGEHW